MLRDTEFSHHVVFPDDVGFVLVVIDFRCERTVVFVVVKSFGIETHDFTPAGDKPQSLAVDIGRVANSLIGPVVNAAGRQLRAGMLPEQFPGRLVETEQATQIDRSGIPLQISGTIITMPDLGGTSQVRTLNNVGDPRFTPGFWAYEGDLKSGFNVTTGDLNGDGEDEIITAPKHGGAPHIRIFDSAGNAKFTPGFYAYAEQIRCGIDLTTGDLDGNGKDEIITIPGEGCPAHVRIFNYLGEPTLYPGFYAYNENVKIGFRIAAGDLNGDGVDEIVTAPAKETPAQVRIFNYLGDSLFTPGFYAYGDIKTGADIGVGDLDANGKAEIVTIPGEGYPSHIRIFNYTGELTLNPGFYAYELNVRTGFHIAVGDINNDGLAEIITAPQNGAPSHIRILNYKGEPISTPGFFAYNEQLKIGADVAVGNNMIDRSPPPSPGSLVQPSDLEYQGAIRLPDGTGLYDSWDWGGSAFAYYPEGDPSGADDSFPGSLFGTGHEQAQYISEISIPEPVISAAYDPNELNTPDTLQGFHDIRGGLFGDLELPRVGLEYLDRQGDQNSGKLYYAWGEHLQEFDDGASHGWFNTTLDDPDRTGPWQIDSQFKYATTDYIFTIPKSWADEYVPGYYLATGRYRDGGQGGQGPDLIAYGPWNDGNPPPADSAIGNTPLLQYSDAYEDPEGNHAMDNYHHSDQWGGGAWLSTNSKSAAVFAGIKGQGDCWYGFYDGTVWPDDPPYPDPGPGERGWWSTSFSGEIVFYNPDDLARVTRGEIETYEPQPYATLDIDDVLFYKPTTELRFLGGVTFDRENGILYISEIRGDQDTQRPIIHVWRVRS